MQENKKQQLEIIKNSNPMLDDYHTGIRNIEDIKTFEETLQDSDWVDYDEFDPDYTREMAEEAIKTGKITVYSSYPIEQGVFVTPSKMEAQDYSRNGKVYSKVVNLKDVAWIDPTQGQYAKTEDRKYSKELTPQTELRLKGNGLNPFDTTRDNEGRKVSKKTQDYFKNTKVRDEFGKLITVYHTTTDSVAQFNEFNPVGTPGYRFGNQVVNYFTNSKDMSGSYANQNYNMADTKKITNMNDVNKYLDTLNKNNTDGNKYDIQKISGINYVIEKSEIDTKALNFLKSLSDKEMQELKDNIYIDSDFTGSAYEKVFSWDKFSKELNDKYQELTKEYVGTEKLVDIQKRMIHYLEHTEKFNDNKVYGGNLIGAYETEEELFRNLKEDIQKTDWTNNSRLQYQGYLNIENPYIIDAEGHNWDRVSIEYDKNIEKVINSIVETQEDKNKLYKLAEESYEKYLDYRKSKEFNEYNDCKNLSTYFNSTKLRKVIDECAMFGFTYSDYIKDEIGNLPSGDTKVKDVNSWFDNLPNDWAKYLEEYGEITLDEYVKKYAKSYKADMRYGQVYSYFNDNMFKTLGKDPFKYYEDLKEKNITPYVFYNLARQKFDENSYKSSFGEAQTTNDIVKKVIEMNKNGANYDGVIIRNTIDYGGYAETHEKADLYVTFNSNQFKSVDNKAPTSDNDIRYSQNFTGAMQRFLDKYARSSGTGKTMQQIKLLTQVKISDFENVLNNATNIPDTEKEELKKNLNNIQLNKNALNDFKNFVIEEDNNYKKLASQNSSTNELSGYSQATYAKYMKKNTDYDRSSLDNAKIMIPANNQGRRTKEQWLSVAKQIGVEIFDKTDSEIEEIAYRTWQDERPNQKDVLNRQGKGYVEFRSNEWVQAVYDSVNEQRKYSKEIDNNKVQLSEKERLKRDSENFSKQVDDYISGNLKSSDYLNLGKTPKLLQDIGLPDEPISMKQSKLKSIMTETDNWNDRNHGLTVDIVKRIPEAISKPLNILKSSTVENSIDIVTDLADKLERPVIVSIEINKRGQIGNVEFMSNRLTSAYGKDNYDRFMKTEIAKGNLLYDIDEGIIKELPASTRLQLSEGLNSLADTVDNVSATNNIIPQSDNKMQENVVDSSSVQKEKVAVILEQPQPRDRKNNVIDILKANVIDKGIVFEELDDQVWKKTKKRTQKLQSRWDYLLLARQRGQHAIGNRRYEFIKGNQVEVSKSLEEIIKEVGSSPKEFYEYMYHQLNIDRMSLESRAQKQLLENKDNLSKKEIKQLEETKNKPVFGNSITAEISMKKVAKLEEKHPEFKKYAQDVYNYLKADKMELVKNGVISQELSDKFEELYPHYVPISRVNRNGKTINVPLDTGRTGINNPKKRATGGNSDIKPLFETMAERTGQIYTASARNSLGLELKNTLAQLGTLNQQAEQTDLDTIIDTVSNEDSEIVKAGTKDNNPTFTVFENGEKKRFDITENIYSALKPVEADYLLNKRIPVLGKINDVRRALITEYNIAFALTNPIKDLQDVVMHSEHSFRTYWETPEAIGSILKKGYWYNEYIQNGGSSNSYFKDGEFDIKQKQPAPVSKVIKLPLEAISKLNNAIEMTPRLAEYIASRKRNCDVQTAMLHASRVTTNFKAGGDFVKFLNRNGATFLNASVQGTVQTVRDIKRANQKGLIGIGYLILRTAIAGIPPYLIMKALWGDDDDYENLSEYAKDNYYIIGKYGDGHFIRIPKGRILASVQKIVANVDEYLNDDKEINIDNVTKDLFTDLKFAWDNMAPNSVSENNLIAPIKQAIKNESWYGEDIIPTRLQDMPAREQYDETIDAFSKFVGETLNISPFKVNYVVDQYSGVIGDVLLPLSTQQAENGLEGIGRILSPLYDKFTVDSKMKNQNVSDIYDLSEKLTVNANSSKASDMDILKSKYINSVTKEMSELYKQKREIQNSNLSDKEKYEEARGVQEQINSLAEIGLSKYENIKIEGNYADVNGVDYYKKDGSWKKLSDKESETLDSLKLNNIEKEYYLNLKNKTSQIEQDYDEKADSLNENSLTYEDDMNDIKNNKKTEIINKISNSSLDEESKIELYKTNFSSSSDTIDRIHKLEIDIDSYMKYSIQDFQADYNVFGKPISGSRKDKVINYLLNMDIPEIQRAILLRKEYPSDESYVYDIVNYIDNLTISYQDKKDLLEYLNFKVEGNSISWD